MHHMDNKIAEAFNQTAVVNNNYGTMEHNPQDEAYDRYVSSNPYK